MEFINQFIEFNAVIIKIFLIFFISLGLIFALNWLSKKFLKPVSNIKILALLFFLSCMILNGIFFSKNFFESAIILLSLGTLLLLPGYIIWLTVIKSDNHDFFETLFTVISMSIIVSSIIGLFLSFAGWFSLYATLSLILIFSLLFYLLFKILARNTNDNRNLQKTGEEKSPFNLEIFTVLVIILFSTLLFFHPFEYIWGGADAGVYLNTGANIAKTGSIWIHDPVFQLLGSSDIHYFFGDPLSGDAIKYEGIRFPGYYIDSFSNGIVIPQFFYLYSVWVALFYSLGGISSALYVVPFFAVFSIMAIFYFTKRMFNLSIAAITAFFLIINLQQLWSARMSLTEVIVQFFLFCGLYMFYRYYSGNNRFFLIVSAIAFGLIFFTRIDSLLLLPIVCLMMLILYLQNNDKTSQKISIYPLDYFSIPAILMIIPSFIINLYVSRPYLFDAMKITAGITPVTVYFITSVVFTGFYLMLKLNWPLRYFDIKKYLFFPHLPVILSLATIILYIFLFFIRPVFMGSDYVMDGSTLLNLYSNENFIRLGWYMSEIGLLFSFSGIIFLLNKDYKKSFLLIFTFAVSFLYFMTNIHNNPVHIYAFRRLLPVVIPIMTLFIAYFCVSLNNLKTHESKKFTYLSIFFIITMFFSLLSITSPMITHVEFQGAVQSVSDISDLTPPLDSQSIIYFQDDLPYHYLATPLTYISDKIVLKIPVNNETIENHLLKNNSTYLITSYNTTPKLNPANLTKINDYSIDTPLYEKSYTRLPTNITRFKMNLTVYKIEK